MPFPRPTFLSFLTVALIFGPTPAWANVKLPAVFSDHAVLQKSNKTALWGKADPGEKITATLARASAGTTAGGDGI